MVADKWRKTVSHFWKKIAPAFAPDRRAPETGMTDLRLLSLSDAVRVLFKQFKFSHRIIIILNFLGMNL
jgi:hypothetical protein